MTDHDHNHDHETRIIETREPSTVRRELVLEVGADAVAHQRDHVLTEVSRNARLDGFRRGKVPLPVIRKRFAREIENELLEQMVPPALTRALAGTGLKPIHRPVISEIDIAEGAALRFTASFEIRPEITPRDYKGVPIQQREGRVDDDMVAAQLEGLRDGAATYVAIEARPLVAGDFVVADIVSESDGEESTHDGALLEVGGSDYHPEFARNLMGQKPGDLADFTVTYGDDDPDPRARGKAVRYRLTVKEIKEKKLPDLDDDFAQDLGEFQTLAELKADLRAKLEARMEHELRSAHERDLAEALVAELDIEVPNAMVEVELDRTLQEHARSLSMRGIDPETAPIDWRQTRARMREGAIRNVKWHLLLDAIAAEEKIEVSESEFADYLRELATENQKSVEFVRSKLEKDGRLDDFRGNLKVRKTVDFLLRNARMERR